ncbi:MAG TPA: T9SS type A sorting domain-containing protein, partial [Bacteroidota bacterium]|nr:T9SS type A sorting domain-containing protein [Bacteroidota bacterium]
THLQGLQSEVRKLIILKNAKVAYALGDNHFLPPYTLLYADLSSLTSLRQDEKNTIKEVNLAQNYPNPFNPSTTIRYGLPWRSVVSLVVFNALGQAVATLVDREQESGYYEVRFDGTNLASGVYFCRLKAGESIRTNKVLLLR